MQWVIRNDEGDFWSNEDGFVSTRAIATVYEDAEKMEVQLPIGGEWFKCKVQLPSPFKVGAEYTLMNGEKVKFVGVANPSSIYQTMFDQHGHHRYTARDFGRELGTGYKDFGRCINLNLVDMTGYETPIWWKNATNYIIQELMPEMMESLAFAEGYVHEYISMFADPLHIDAEAKAAQQVCIDGHEKMRSVIAKVKEAYRA